MKYSLFEGAVSRVSDNAEWREGRKDVQIRTLSRWRVSGTPFGEDIGIFWAPRYFLEDMSDFLSREDAEEIDPELVSCGAWLEAHPEIEAALWKLVDEVEQDEASLYRQIGHLQRSALPYSVHLVEAPIGTALFRMIAIRLKQAMHVME